MGAKDVKDFVLEKVRKPLKDALRDNLIARLGNAA
jgi:hypothetical protein